MRGQVSLDRAVRGHIYELFMETMPVDLEGKIEAKQVLISHHNTDRFTLSTVKTGKKNGLITTIYVNDVTREDKGVVGYVDFNLTTGRYEAFVLKPYRKQNIKIEFDLTFKVAA